jgi:hypothetical protein
VSVVSVSWNSRSSRLVAPRSGFCRNDSAGKVGDDDRRLIHFEKWDIRAPS